MAGFVPPATAIEIILYSLKGEIFDACLTLVVSQKWDTTSVRQVSHQKKLIWLKKNEISQMGGAKLLSQKKKICKCISYAHLTGIWLAVGNSWQTKFKTMRKKNYMKSEWKVGTVTK